jgi:outer membrane protein assembly factor BamB
VSSPVVVDRTIVIGAGDGNVYALDLTTGKERWRAKTSGKVRATPSVRDGVAVVGSWDGRVYAIDMATGRTRWVHHTVGDTLDLKREGYDRRAIQSGSGGRATTRRGSSAPRRCEMAERTWEAPMVTSFNP